MIQKHNTEKEKSSQHRKGSSVVRESGRNETLVLVVAEGADGDTGDSSEGGVAGTLVVNLEGKHSIDVWELEGGGEVALAIAVEVGADIGVEHDEFELDILGIERNPLSVDALLDHDGVVDVWQKSKLFT